MYFNPSILKNESELQWMRKGDGISLWVFQCPDEQMSAAEDMMIEKLIRNPKVLNENPDSFHLLRFTGKERLSFIRKQIKLEKVVLLGIPPAEFGIHIKWPQYNILSHAGIDFLQLDAPHLMPSLPSAQKGSIAHSLKLLYDTQ